MSEIINRVANSGLITFNLENYFPKDRIRQLDIKDYLFKGLILKEKDFREALIKLEWSQFSNCHVHIHCSADAIIPIWAYMLISSYLEGIAKNIYYGDEQEMLSQYYRNILGEIDFTQFAGERIIIKGCSNKPVPTSAYLLASYYLKPHVRSIMFGEPCSTVPIFKRKTQKVKS